MSDFLSGSEIATQEDVSTILTSIAPQSKVDDEYDHFMLLTYEGVKSLVADCWDSSWIVYGSDSPDFPLCYDFAAACEMAVRTAAIKKNFKMRPAFGVLRYTMNAMNDDGQNIRHAICFVVTSNCQIKYFEPQIVETGRWMDTPRDMKSLDNFYI